MSKLNQDKRTELENLVFDFTGKFIVDREIDRICQLFEPEPLFKLGDFPLHSGGRSSFFIDCDALTDEDWGALANEIENRVPHFREVIGIPTGGLKLAEALKPYRFPNPEYPILIVDGVLTTGKSMEEEKAKHYEPVIGAVVFARGNCPSWIMALFQMPVKDLKPLKPAQPPAAQQPPKPAPVQPAAQVLQLPQPK